MPFDGKGCETQINALDKIDKVIDLLATPDRWCKGELRSSDGRRCIIGAIAEVDGRTALNVPILHAIAQVTGQTYRRIEIFNDDERTTHEVVLQVLHHARQNILLGDAATDLRSVRRAGLLGRVLAFF